MRTIIVGSGRVGAGLASKLSRDGHEVAILDVKTQAFRRLEAGFGGQAIRGDGTDEAVLRRAGAEGADWFFALTNGDNRNVLSAQLAAETFGIPRVVAKINDPVRAEAYAALGIDTVNRTDWMIDAIERYMGSTGDHRKHSVNVATEPEHRGPDHVPAGADPAAAIGADQSAASTASAGSATTSGGQ
jgi:Trk K+ transport system NAD-binding subunit